MSCNHPLKAFRTGLLTDSGKEFFRLSSTHDEIYPLRSFKEFDPSRLEDDEFTFLNAVTPALVNPVDVPCGKCAGCRMDRAKEWKQRCLCELSSNNGVGYFVTLTFDDDSLKKFCCLPSGEVVLFKRPLQLFFKRLRKRGCQFRYFACGEYGSSENTRRPHYHIIFFGDAFKDIFRDSFGLWHSSLLDESWPFGHVAIFPALPGNIAYTCGYVEKKQSNPDWFTYNPSFLPFITMSRRPAVGDSYFRSRLRNFVDGYRLCYPASKPGDKLNVAKVPRYLIKTLSDADREKIKLRSLETAERFSDIDDCIYNTPDKMAIGFIKDSNCTEKLKDKRKLKL